MVSRPHHNREFWLGGGRLIDFDGGKLVTMAPKKVDQ